jgi:hypothetical protein
VECAEAVKQAKRRAAREFRNNSGLMTWIGRAKATNRKKTVIRRWRRTNYQEGVEEAVKEGNLWRLASLSVLCDVVVALNSPRPIEYIWPNGSVTASHHHLQGKQRENPF